jgi:NAD-dependent dihydropyrimidine dehydrogenase PreA subunit
MEESMSIEVKSTDKCFGCVKKHSFPPCAVNEFRKSGDFIDIIDGNAQNSKTQNFLVCPVDAIKSKGEGVVFKNNLCISCGLCIQNCPYDNIKLTELVKEENIYPHLTNNVLQIASYLRSKLDDEYEIFTEVKAEGNARNKRIDIVVTGNNKVYLIKVLSTEASGSKYQRDYEEILNKIVNIRKDKIFEVVFLYCKQEGIEKQWQYDINGKNIKINNISLEYLQQLFN